MLKYCLTLYAATAALGINTTLAEDAPPPPPAPAAPLAPAPPVPPAPPHRPASEPTTFLGVGVESVPGWATDQINLPPGLGLLVNYVVPGGPAEKAGVKSHDILTKIDAQLLANGEQLTALVQSMPEGQTVTLTAIRKGQETKLTVKLEKRAAYTPDLTVMSAADAADDFKRLPKSLTRGIVDKLGPEIHDLVEGAGRKAADRVRREIMILRDKDGRSNVTEFDLGRYTWFVSDRDGELEIHRNGEESTVTAKDKTGKTVYTGALKDAPADLKERVGRIQKSDFTASDKSEFMISDDPGPAKPDASPSPAK